jgi:hypothetical protein
VQLRGKPSIEGALAFLLVGRVDSNTPKKKIKICKVLTANAKEKVEKNLKKVAKKFAYMKYFS